MIKLGLGAAALAAATLAWTPAGAQTLDSAGKCRGPGGKYVAASACKGAGAAAPGVKGYKLDAKGKCRDPKGKFVDQARCKA